MEAIEIISSFPQHVLRLFGHLRGLVEVAPEIVLFGPTIALLSVVNVFALSRMLLGSVAEKVVRLAHCPVLVLRW